MLLELPFAFFFFPVATLCHALFLYHALPCQLCAPSILANLPSLSSASLNLQHLIQAQRQPGESNL